MRESPPEASAAEANQLVSQGVSMMNARSSVKSIAVALSLAAVVLASSGLCNPVHAQEEPGNGPVDAKELEQFLDGFFVEWMDTLHVPGLAFVLVRDGEIFFAKGYGFSDLETK